MKASIDVPERSKELVSCWLVFLDENSAQASLATKNFTVKSYVYIYNVVEAHCYVG